VGLILSNWLEVLFILFMLGILVLHNQQVLHTALLILLVLLALRELFQLRSALPHSVWDPNTFVTDPNPDLAFLG
jgi:hypothetical protein